MAVVHSTRFGAAQISQAPRRVTATGVTKAPQLFPAAIAPGAAAEWRPSSDTVDMEMGRFGETGPRGLRSALLAVCVGVATGCVSRGTYDRALADLAQARDEATDHFHEAEALRADEKRFEADARRCAAEEAELKGAN